MLVLSHKIGQGLKKLKIQQGDVVALIGINGHKIHAAALGAVWQGGVFAPLDPTLKSCKMKYRQIGYVFDHNDYKHAISFYS